MVHVGLRMGELPGGFHGPEVRNVEVNGTFTMNKIL